MKNRLQYFWGWMIGLGWFVAAGCSLHTPQVVPSQQKGYKAKALSVVWRAPLIRLGYESINPQFYGTPVVSQDGRYVFAGDIEGGFQCLDARTGKLIWQKLLKGPVESVPILSGEVVFVGTIGGSMHAFRIRDGAEIWNYATNAAIEGKPTFADDKILFMTNTNAINCLSALNGEWLWSYKRPIPTARFQIKGLSNPMVTEDRVFVGFSDGFLVVLSLLDGRVETTKKLFSSEKQFKDIDSNFVVFNNMILVSSFSMGIVALARDTLEQLWNYPADGPSQISIQDGIAYFSQANSKVVALDLKQPNRPLWIFSSEKGELSQPTVTDKWLLVSSSKDSLIVLDRETGNSVQIIDPGKGSRGLPVVAGNRVYWISSGQILYAMKLDS